MIERTLSVRRGELPICGAFLQPLTRCAIAALRQTRRYISASRAVFVILAVAGFAYHGTAHAADGTAHPVPTAAYQALQWRNVGPFRGGRTTAVAGVASEPHTFYIGASGGGVWETTNAGKSWHNISDGYLHVGSIGAIAVAPSNPGVIYVGTGEASVRNHSTTPGDGVYKSTDGGQTWTYLGLPKTRHIASIVVDPNNANVVYVAAQGNAYKPTQQRGVYRSRDGGKTWHRVLFVNDTTGAHSLSIDPNHPKVLYAGMWDYRRKPWHLRSGGPGSGVWKSVDGGDHWQRLTAGLPHLMGNVAVAVSPPDPEWVYAMIEAPEGGVFRSEDAGAHWKRVSGNQGLRARAWYYTRIVADPFERGTVYVLGNSFGKSTDGGETFAPIRVPHGDNQDLWINPKNNNVMVEGNDGGGTVSLDGGTNWSSELNQPTGQFYRVAVDDQFPYRLYGAQQDRQTVSLPNRSLGFRGISAADIYGVGGGESGHIALDENDPALVYATGLLGTITRYNQRTKELHNIEPYPYWAGFRVPRNLKYRFSWTSPVVVSQTNPDVVYMGAQVVLESTDNGKTWHAISPDLTRDNEAHQGTEAGPISIAGGGYQTYDVITSMALSPVASGTLWVGSDDGLVHVTRDGGKHWKDVTPAAIRRGHSYVRQIDISDRHPGTVYLAANRYRFGDIKPLIYVTRDYGRSWKRIVNGLPSDGYAMAVRADPKRDGLVYAGTDRGVYVTFNGGKLWQPLQLNLPAAPVSGLRVHGDDLVISTLGRGFWVLDGLHALRQLSAKVVNADMHLFKPSTSYRLNRSFGGGPGPYGRNPPSGVVIYYSFANAPDIRSQPVTLEILDQDGKVIRTFTSAKQASRPKRGNAFAKGVGATHAESPVHAKAGMNRYVWRFRVAPYVPTMDVIRYGGEPVYRVAPGTYSVRLNYGGKTQTRRFKVTTNPNQTHYSRAQWQEQQAFLGQLRGLVNEANRANNRMRSVAQQVNERMEQAVKHGRTPICTAGNALLSRIWKWEQQTPQPPLPNNVQDYTNWPSRSFVIPVLHLISATGRSPPVSPAAKSVAQLLNSRWHKVQAGMHAIISGPLAEFDHKLKKIGLAPVNVPQGNQAAPLVTTLNQLSCASE